MTATLRPADRQRQPRPRVAHRGRLSRAPPRRGAPRAGRVAGRAECCAGRLGPFVRDRAPSGGWIAGAASSRSRSPGGLLNVGDPSRPHAVLDDRPGTDEVECTKTGGIGFLARATLGGRVPSRPRSGPTREWRRHRPRMGDAVPRPGWNSANHCGHTGCPSPRRTAFPTLWNGWQRPITLERVAAFRRHRPQSLRGTGLP